MDQPPPVDREILDTLNARLDAILGGAPLRCSVCGSLEWEGGPIVQPPIVTRSHPASKPFGPTMWAFPLVTLTCVRCSNTLFFPAIPLITRVGP